MDLSAFLPFALAGLLVGTLVGATGVGGGSLMTPILVMVFGVSPSTAVGTDLLFAAITKGVGTTLHGLNRSVSWKVVSRLSMGSIPAALVTLWALHNLFDQKQVSGFITTALGVALLLTSVAIFTQPLLKKLFRRGKSPSEFPELDEGSIRFRRVIVDEAKNEARPEAAAYTIATGVVLGTVVTLTSVGAGALGVMVLMTLYPKVRSVRIVGTDIAHAVPLTLVSGLGHASMGGVDFTMLGALLVGSIPGIAVGSHLAFRLPERAMKQVLAAILMLVGGKLIF